MSEQNKFRCEHCARNVSGTKKLDIKVLPPCHVFHLKRFPDVGTKYLDPVSFPLSLDLSSVTDATSNETSPTALYECVAVCNHRGGRSNSGHFTALARRGATWFWFDDSAHPAAAKAMNIAIRNCFKGAYLIFYVRR
jgi:ubiquitin C-terminal hydrolase